MKNYSNPYQAPALEMLEEDNITSKYNGRIEQGFRALFAGTDGWYDLYRDANGNVYKSKLGAGGSSGGGGGGSGVTEDFLNDNYYNKTAVDNKIIEVKNQQSVAQERSLNQFFSNFELNPNIAEYYIYLNLSDEELKNIYINVPSAATTWKLHFVAIDKGTLFGEATTERTYQIYMGLYMDLYEITLHTNEIISVQYSMERKDYTTREWKEITPSTKKELQELKDMVSAIPKFSIEVVSELPKEGISTSTIYLVTNKDPQDENLYKEYIYIEDKGWELLGTQTSNINLSNYYTKEEVDNKNYLTKEGLEENNIGLSSFVNDMGYVLSADVDEKLQDCGVLDDNYNSVIPLIQENIQDLQTHVLNPFDEEEHPLTFTTNKIYKLEATDNNLELTFEDVAENEKEQLNQILIYLKLTQETAIEWRNQVVFVGDQIPSLATGYYRIIAEFNPFLEKWVIGVIQDGPEVSSEAQ